MSSPTAEIKSMSAIKPCQMVRLRRSSLVRGVPYMPDGRRVIACSEYGSFRIWDLKSGAQIGTDWRNGERAVVVTIELSPSGETIASGSDDGTVRLWDIKTERVITKCSGHTDYVWSIRWSADGERVVSGSSDGTVRVWDVESGDTLLGPIHTGHESVFTAIYSPDRANIATGGASQGIKIWGARTGKLLSVLPTDQRVWRLAWTSDEKLISGSYDGAINIFNAITWQRIASLEGHQSTVNSISLSQNNGLLASTSWDGTARLWNLRTNLPVGPPLQHEHFVVGAVISTDGKQLVTGCDGGTVCVWDIDTIVDCSLEVLPSIPSVS
jgi:WD40 repeat protein